ncbi:MAG: hypothetical protein KUL83_01480 [Lentimicrobium sp.]|jgi:outer membrane protein assembly factor BamE (lipoprotein component of BamABCDE complex)|nr:hypothetical protein [Lentimicrobium sp.]MDD2529321.1 hypothetical protein [Lentimicrobiaceae bacterium]MDD4599041.1 hypothetical protein [Lentimicrobiaceae bacterium]MDY0027036.1 hypothetical protein [Lentimicrobium sp.]HAH57802.1 hypothetical protein [Bacteroidales bacterium]
MKIKLKYGILLSFAMLLLMAFSSCSTPRYKQNKYKSGKRYNDCGCQMVKPNTGYALSYYEIQ